MTLGQIKKPLSSKDGSATLRNSDTGATFRKLFNMNWTIDLNIQVYLRVLSCTQSVTISPACAKFVNLFLSYYNDITNITTVELVNNDHQWSCDRVIVLNYTYVLCIRSIILLFIQHTTHTTRHIGL